MAGFPSITPIKCRVVAHRSAARLVAMVGEEGRFLYRYPLGRPEITDAAYSKARHLAALLALLEAEHRLGPLPGADEAIRRSADFVRDKIVEPAPTADALRVVEDGYAKLGAASLAIVVATGLARHTGEAAWLDRAVRLARYVVGQRREGGDFIHLRDHPAGTPSPRRSDFYTGQALCGLAVLSNATGDQSWASAALESVAKLNAVGALKANQWTLYALEALHVSVPDEWLERIAAAHATAILEDESYRKIQESTPVACATEGLLAYLRLARRSRAEAADRLVIAATNRVRQNLRLQLRYYDLNGAFVHSAARQEVRIDYIAHNLFGFLGYWAQGANGLRVEIEQAGRPRPT